MHSEVNHVERQLDELHIQATISGHEDKLSNDHVRELDLAKIAGKHRSVILCVEPKAKAIEIAK